MKTTHIAKAAAVLGIASLALTACAANEAPAGDSSSSASGALSGTLNGVGASSQGSAQEAWIAGFQTANNGVTVNYSPEGSGAGREQFIAGGVDFAGSDAYLSDEELSGDFGSCKAGTTPIDLPVYISPIAIVFNLEGVDSLNLDADTIAKIFKGDITTWNDPAIAATNPDATLPDTAITPVHRSDDSGTTENFTEYLTALAPDTWDKGVTDVFPYDAGEGAKGTSGVVSAVSNGQGTIGYADASKAGDLGVASIKVGDTFQAPTAEAASKVVEVSPRVEGRADADLAYDLDRTVTEAGAYPLVLISYLITCSEYNDPAKAELVKAYATYVASADGQQAAADHAGSAPLSDTLTEAITASIETIK